MPAKVLMVQGTASSVGKSTLVTALCRIFRQDGWRVAPFKAQNMSLNSFVTADGGEIGRAQVVQAEAAGVEPTVEMNPILLKPETDRRSQVIVRGKPWRSLPADEYFSSKDLLWPIVTDSLTKLMREYEIVIIEGAGSPVEMNLKDRDIVNMRVAQFCKAPVLLVADIDLGGVFASIVGTLTLLDAGERRLVQGLVINKFRGDLALFEPGVRWLAQHTGVPVLGVVPFLHDMHIAEEDSMPLAHREALRARTDFVLDIAVIGLPHIANFDDFDPLMHEPGVRLRYIEKPGTLGRPDLIILPGTKTTMADLQYLRSVGTADEIKVAASGGTPVIGICGGYQMLGASINDPDHIESRKTEVAGLGLLPVVTTFAPTKTTHQVTARVLGATGLLAGAAGMEITGYEIHMGQTRRDELAAAMRIEQRGAHPCNDDDGCTNAAGTIFGTYLHGLFHNENLRQTILVALAARKGVPYAPAPHTGQASDKYDRLAQHFRACLNMESIYAMMDIHPARHQE